MFKPYRISSMYFTVGYVDTLIFTVYFQNILIFPVSPSNSYRVLLGSSSGRTQLKLVRVRVKLYDMISEMGCIRVEIYDPANPNMTRIATPCLHITIILKFIYFSAPLRSS